MISSTAPRCLAATELSPLMEAILVKLVELIEDFEGVERL